MKRLISMSIVAVVSLAGSAAFAQGMAGGGGGAPYGTAGCGLGSLVFGNSPGFVQVLAATTNGTFASQTFGITTGTSNCVDTGGGAGATAAFVESNRDVLAKDISRGSGETIATLTTLAGCKDDKAVGSTLQSHFSEIFPSSEVTNVEVSGKVVSILRSDSTLSCTKLQRPVKKQGELAQK